MSESNKENKNLNQKDWEEKSDDEEETKEAAKTEEKKVEKPVEKAVEPTPQEPKKVHQKTKNGDIIISKMETYKEPEKKIKEARGDTSKHSLHRDPK